jgi:hypothetical protein
MHSGPLAKGFCGVNRKEIKDTLFITGAVRDEKPFPPATLYCVFKLKRDLFLKDYLFQMN